MQTILFTASLFQVAERSVEFYVQGLRNWCESIVTAQAKPDQQFSCQLLVYCQQHLREQVQDLLQKHSFLAVYDVPPGLENIMYGAMWRYIPHYFIAYDDKEKYSDIDICISIDLDKLFLGTVYYYSIATWLSAADSEKRWMVQTPWWAHWFTPEVSGDFLCVKRGARIGTAAHSNVGEWTQTIIDFGVENIDAVRQQRRVVREFFYGLDELFLTMYLWPLIEKHSASFVFLGAPINGRRIAQ